MFHKTTRFAGPFLLSISAIALMVPAAAIAADKVKPASGSKAKSGDGKIKSAMKLSSRYDEGRRDRPRDVRDGRDKDGPRDPGRPRPGDGDGDNPTSP